MPAPNSLSDAWARLLTHKDSDGGLYISPHELTPISALIFSTHQSPSSSVQRNSTRPFSRIPEEVLIEIIKYVHTFSRAEAPIIRRLKAEKVLKEPHGIAFERWTYDINQAHPILNSVQSLSVVNRELYELSRPFLWNVRLQMAVVNLDLSVHIDDIFLLVYLSTYS